MTRKYAFPCIFLALMACDDKECVVDEDIAAIGVEISVERKEEEVFSAASPAEVESFLTSNRTLADYFLDANQYPADSVLARQVFNLTQHLDSLREDVDRKFTDAGSLEEKFEQAFRHMKYYYPPTKVPKVQTMITGFYRDIYYSDSLIVIGLDYFVGDDALFKPDNVPAYIARRFSPEYIVPATFMFIADQYNQIDFSDQSLLNDMVAAGKTYYFIQSMMPCVAESVIIGFSEEEMVEVNKNQDIVWANFIQNQLLYETSHMLKNKFMSERPNVYEIGEKCPGRIGAWVGWEIVKAYMDKNPKVTLQKLMEEKDVKKIFMLSKYRPNPH